MACGHRFSGWGELPHGFTLFASLPAQRGPAFYVARRGGSGLALGFWRGLLPPRAPMLFSLTGLCMITFLKIATRASVLPRRFMPSFCYATLSNPLWDRLQGSQTVPVWIHCRTQSGTLWLHPTAPASGHWKTASAIRAASAPRPPSADAPPKVARPSRSDPFGIE